MNMDDTDKVLVLLRGAPGCGKDGFIKDGDLKPYTISADELRLMYRNPVLLKDPIDFESTNIDVAHYTIDQECNSLVFDTLYKMIDNRLMHGDFTIVNCTFSTKEEILKAKEIADKYDFKIIIINFVFSREKMLNINKLRQLGGGGDNYIQFTGMKYIPESVIELFTERFSKPLSESIPEGIKEIIHINGFDDEDKVISYLRHYAYMMRTEH